jgi:4-hydroxy-3-polyprenylbenzoate decarboxylase
MKRKGSFLVISGIMLGLFLSSLSFGAEELKTTGPYDSFRDYIAALEARGKVLKVAEVDQDNYEGTALMFRLIEEYGADRAPVIMFEKIKIDGEWRKGPVVANIYRGWDTAAMVYGVEKISDNQKEMYRAVMDKMSSYVDEGGQWKQIPPVAVDKTKAPCKEVIITGDDIDITKFPWFKNNPGDVGRYINSGAVFMEDPRLGRNVGTYRCQVKGPKKIGLNTEVGQHGWQFMMRAKRRGEKVKKVAIALGTDPILFAMSTSKLAGLGEDELDFTGGFKGKPVELVKCETSDLLVPANAEMIIEGEAPTGEVEDEGPYGEMFGYMGKQHKNFYMNITAITHRRQPLFFNNFTGVTKSTRGVATHVGSYMKLKKVIPNLVQLYSVQEAVGIKVLSIDKRFPGQGIAAGQIAAGSPTAKILIVVDKDVDVMNITEVLHAVATRWQPHPASLIIPQANTFMLDPSLQQRSVTSKIVIDATRQLPAEGGPKSFARLNRTILQEEAPQSFEIVEEKWSEYMKDWKK